MRLPAMIGTGLIATPTAKVRISLMPCAIGDPLARPAACVARSSRQEVLRPWRQRAGFKVPSTLRGLGAYKRAQRLNTVGRGGDHPIRMMPALPGHETVGVHRRAVL